MSATAYLARRLSLVSVTAVLLTACGTSFKDPGPISYYSSGANPRVNGSGPPLQCVPFARDNSGVRIFGDANTWWAQAKSKFETQDMPVKGAVIVIRGFNSDARAHVAVVRKILDDRQLTVDHANWGNRGEIQLDTPVMDVSSSNDWSKVRVWNTESGHFGGRVYEVKGFIVPERRSAGGLFW